MSRKKKIGTLKAAYKVRKSRPGMAPGTLIADPKAQPPRVDVIAYGGDGASMVEKKNVGLDDIRALNSEAQTLWVNVNGLGEIDLITELGQIFGLHPLALEDVVNVHQRAKAESYEEVFFVVSRIPPHDLVTETEQFSLFFGSGFLISFQEWQGDVFEPVRDRLRSGKGRIRQRGADYLAYALIDTLIDSYFPVLERYGEKLEALENQVLGDPGPETVEQIHGVKRELLELRRIIWPHREMINSLMRDDNEIVTETTMPYLRDCYDHSIQLFDILETFRELSTGLIDIYLSSVSNRMNEVMKVLTIIATIFMPLGFIAGLYGMNFDREASAWNMPELGWRFGYPLALGIMGICALGLIYYFRRKGWIGGRKP